MYETAAGPNAGLIGVSAEAFTANVATPALCVERSAFTRNVASMQQAATRAGKALRPHMKGHKSRTVAAMQRDAGAIGISCATAKEVETAASAGIESILLTTPVASPMVLHRLGELAAAGHDIILALDTAEGVSRAAGAMGTKSFRVVIDVNVGQNRTGVANADDALALAAAIVESGMQLCGVQAYYGHLQHVKTLMDRQGRIDEQVAKIAPVVAALREAGYTVDIVTGGGTGTAELDLASGAFTEIQPGSYLFLDSQYADVERRAIPLEHSLTVVARVNSATVANQVVIDCGTKGLSTDPATFRLASPTLPGVTHRFMGDEHSALSFPEGSALPKVGDLVSIIATHCDPTVNLYDRFHVMESGKLIDIWAIEARGY
ncbi:MAG: alanine racemase [Devosia sp.]